MMKKPQLEKIKGRLEKGRAFELSNEQYRKLTDSDFPKSKYYAEKNSAVAKLARQYGFQIKVIPQRIIFEKMA